MSEMNVPINLALMAIHLQLVLFIAPINDLMDELTLGRAKYNNFEDVSVS